MQKRQDMVLVIAEDYPSLYKVNELWPGHAVLIPPVLDVEAAHKFGSQNLILSMAWCLWADELSEVKRK
ncbi:UDP-galactose:fucoside alpha-3-galactosyltransferase [Trifolium pratense]|uniref:UDP-galactose:fucoside alpha-3-galactosyltransferase n=1 Tax=Trifolium pratense TaxID=57577 RepID=A0A2K3LPG7_TRIPR|nr:UDP-galactose:fucoside alpha-3-galactosyltransferase [Trifolium pratense]